LSVKISKCPPVFNAYACIFIHYKVLAFIFILFIRTVNKLVAANKCAAITIL
jgi:hypothetical protein